MKCFKMLLLLTLFSFTFCTKSKNEKVVSNSKQTESGQSDNKDSYDQNDIKKAIELNQSEFVDYIANTKDIDSFYQFEKLNSYTILGYCCKYDRYDFVKKIISRKADISLGKQDETYEFDALFVAIENQNERMVNLLLEHKANVNSIYTESGISPLSLACRFSNFKIIETLINKGADIKGNYNPESEMASIPILEAVISKNKEAIKLLAEKGADIDQVNLEGVSALSYAKSHDQQIYDFLLNYAK